MDYLFRLRSKNHYRILLNPEALYVEINFIRKRSFIDLGLLVLEGEIL
jgi:hypothetical protein